MIFQNVVFGLTRSVREGSENKKNHTLNIIIYNTNVITGKRLSHASKFCKNNYPTNV